MRVSECVFVVNAHVWYCIWLILTNKSLYSSTVLFTVDITDKKNNNNELRYWAVKDLAKVCKYFIFYLIYPFWNAFNYGGVFYINFLLHRLLFTWFPKRRPDMDCYAMPGGDWIYSTQQQDKGWHAWSPPGINLSPPGANAISERRFSAEASILGGGGGARGKHHFAPPPPPNNFDNLKNS